MGPAYPRLVLLAAVVLLSTGFLPQAFGRGKGRGGAVHPQVEGICGRTLFPELCKSTAGRHASKYPVMDNQAVLSMQMDAFAKRTAQARKQVSRASRTVPPVQKPALTFCDTMYQSTQDDIGAAQRATTFKDTGTTKIMLQLAIQNFDSCDRPFKEAGIPNPLGKINAELSQMANNCMVLDGMI